MRTLSLALPRPHWPMALLVLACALAGIGLAHSRLAQHWGLGALALAMLLGLVVAQPLPAPLREAGGSALALFKGPILKIAIVLYGLRIPLDAVSELDLGVIALNAGQIALSLVLGGWLGQRWLGMSRAAALSIGAGNGICGAAAVLAAEPVLGTRDRDTAMAVAAVVVFGTLNMLLLPLLYHHLPTLFPDQNHFAVLVGASVQEVAQVIVAAQAMSPALVDSALLVKMVRVMMLAPVLLILGMGAQRAAAAGAGTSIANSGIRARPVLPAFAFWFVGALVVNGLGWVPDSLASPLAGLDDILLALAMAALGLSTHFDLLRRAGWRPLALGAILWLATLAVVFAALLSGAV
ncbi:YeiH family protein [Alloalcanivorax xenomutans]|uniref:YeiH family protein n=1 Tax=Alloalcanivorax xenomutans TaxID=1094342 RepID=UPI001F4918B7|nr:putative sulfate exporter family transporter [Alloalcanivorax xenomutans]MCE7522552.1 putative sulfate exporter family transporter [Alloalcanivorax xenomutans]